MANPRSKIARVISYLERFQKDPQLARHVAGIIDATRFLAYLSRVEDWEENHPEDVRRLLAELVKDTKMTQRDLACALDRLVEEAAGPRRGRRKELRES